VAVIKEPCTAVGNVKTSLWTKYPQNRLDKGANFSLLAGHFLTWKERNATYLQGLLPIVYLQCCLFRNKKPDQSRSTVIQKFRKMLGVAKSYVTWILKGGETARNGSV
jgi:hypothetical protein